MRSTRVLTGLAVGVFLAGSLSACFSEPEAVLVHHPIRPFIDLPSTGTASAEVDITVTNIGHAETGAFAFSSQVNGVFLEHAGIGGTCETLDSLGPLESCTINFGVTGGPAPTGPYDASIHMVGADSGDLTIPVFFG